MGLHQYRTYDVKDRNFVFYTILLVKTCLVFILLFYSLSNNAADLNKCDAAMQIVGLCSGGLEQKTARKIQLTINSINISKKSEFVGSLAESILNDKLVGSSTILEALDKYFECVSKTATDILAISAALNQIQPDGKSLDLAALDALQKKIPAVIVQSKNRVESSIKEYFVEVGVSENKIAQLTPMDASQSAQATNALSDFPIKFGVPTIKSKVSLFAKGKSDPGFSYPELKKILSGFGLKYDDAKIYISNKESFVDWYPTNTIWFNSHISDFRNVKIVALIMIGAGARITNIEPICLNSPNYKSKELIQIGAFPKAKRKNIYTVDEVLQKNQADFIRLDNCE